MSPRVEPEMTVRAGDGTALVGDLFLPASTPAPCVVVRTPYGSPGLWPEAAALANAGLAVLVQDVRGRHRSGGEFRPGADEGPDGAVTLDWVAARSWCDGRVLLSGIGYEAFAAWCASGHPAVRAVASRQPWPSAGVPALDEELWWRTELGTGGAVRPGLYDLVTALSPGIAEDPGSPGFAGRWPVPLGPWPPTPSTWKEAGRLVTRAVRATTVPTLHLGSWYCGSAQTTLRQARLAADPTVIMGGWASQLTHRLQPECALLVPDEPDATDLMLSWLATRALGGEWTAPERCLVLAQGWTSRDPLPPAHPTYLSLPLHPKHALLRHDPAHPFRSLPHSADLGTPTPRPDVLRLTLPAPLTWHGSPRLTTDVQLTTNAQLPADAQLARDAPLAADALLAAAARLAADAPLEADAPLTADARLTSDASLGADARLTADAPLEADARLTGDDRTTAGGTVKEAVQVVATFVHVRPDGVRTRVTDAAAPVPPKGGRVELWAAPTAVSLPEGHELQVELTVGRPPRYAAPGVPVEVGLELGPLLLPQPKDQT